MYMNKIKANKNLISTYLYHFYYNITAPIYILFKIRENMHKYFKIRRCLLYSVHTYMKPHSAILFWSHYILLLVNGHKNIIFREQAFFF